MTSQIPLTPLTPGSMARLTLDEQLAFQAATMTVARDQKPSLEVIATLVLAVQRLIGEPGETPRPDDQQLPVPNDGPSMHDLVTEDLKYWTAPDAEEEAVVTLLAERKRLGLERYASLLQAGNGRDWRRDLAEELADAAVYARQGLEELGPGAAHDELAEVYDQVVDSLLELCRITGVGRG